MRAGEHQAGFGIADDLFFFRIPFQRITMQSHGDVPQMTNCDRTMRDFGRRDRFFAGQDAIDEISKMIRALVEMNLVFLDLGTNQILGRG